jgi:hypothetical protein
MNFTSKYGRILFWLSLFSTPFVLPHIADAQVSRKYRSAPSALAIYMYQGDGIESVLLPADITVRFSAEAQTSMLTAVIHKPIIGDRATGIDYPIVEEFPMVVTGLPSTDGMSFEGRLLDTQYHFDWSFELAANGDLLWSGGVAWFGGRYEETAIDNVRLIPLTPGDYSENGKVDAADYAIWRKSAGQTGFGLAADGDGDNHVDADDYLIWREHIGQSTSTRSLASTTVPEPAAWALAVAALPAVLRRRARK